MPNEMKKSNGRFAKKHRIKKEPKGKKRGRKVGTTVPT